MFHPPFYLLVGALLLNVTLKLEYFLSLLQFCLLLAPDLWSITWLFTYRYYLWCALSFSLTMASVCALVVVVFLHAFASASAWVGRVLVVYCTNWGVCYFLALFTSLVLYSTGVAVSCDGYDPRAVWRWLDCADVLFLRLSSLRLLAPCSFVSSEPRGCTRWLLFDS